jgi:hypothetical protein
MYENFFLGLVPPKGTDKGQSSQVSKEKKIQDN